MAEEAERLRTWMEHHVAGPVNAEAPEGRHVPTLKRAFVRKGTSARATKSSVAF